MAASLHAATVNEAHHEHHNAFDAYSRYGSYSEYHLANYAHQRSTAYFGTVPRGSLDADASHLDLASYQHPDAIPNGLVAPADEYVTYEQPEHTWVEHRHGSSPPVPLTPMAMAYLAAHPELVHAHAGPEPTGLAGLHIDTDLAHAQTYAPLSTHPTPPASVYHTPVFTPYSPSTAQRFHQYISASAMSSPMDPGDQPFIFPPGHPAAAPVDSSASGALSNVPDYALYQSSPCSSELANWNAGYEEVAAPTVVQHALPLAVPTPRTPVSEDVREGLERYASDSPHASCSDHSHCPDSLEAWAEADTYWAAHSHASVGFAEHVHPELLRSVESPDDRAYSLLPQMVAPHELEASSSTSAQLAPSGVDRGRKRRKRTPEPRKPLVMACLFCRGRKIACGAPPPGSKDRSCDQCKRRNQPCEYPTVYRRGQRRPREEDEATEASSIVEGSSKDNVVLLTHHDAPRSRSPMRKDTLKLSVPPIAPAPAVHPPTRRRTALETAIKLERNSSAPQTL